MGVRIGLAGVTYALVCVAYVFFRAESFGQAFAMVSRTPDLLAYFRRMKHSPGDKSPGAFFIDNN